METVSAQDDGSQAQPQAQARHVPIQMPYCLLCRFPAQPSELVRAVLSIDGSDAFSGYTPVFAFPRHRAGHPSGAGPVELTQSATDTVPVNLRRQASPLSPPDWTLCRSPLCKTCEATETFLYHIDCHAAVAAARGHPLKLEELWTVGAWTRPVPGVPYQAEVRSLLASAVSSLGNEYAPALQHVPEIGDLPWELREMIAWHSIDSPLWRMLSALFRFEKVKTLLQPGEEEIVYELSRIREWQRESGGDVSYGSARDGNDSVRAYLDDYGMQRIEHFSSQLTSYTQARVYTASWYIVEPLTFVDGVKVKVKGNFARLQKSSSSSLQIWDTPDPPPPPIRWYDMAYIPRSIRCVDLHGAASLAVYCYNGRAFCIKPHPRAGPVDDPPEFMLHSIKAQDIVRLSVPLQDAGDAESFWVQDHRPWQDDSLLLVTGSGRLHVLGSCRHRILSGITPLAGNPRYILLPASDDGGIARNFGVSAACRVPGWRSVVDMALQCNPLTMRRLMAAPTYMSTASAEGVVRARLFRRRCAALCGMRLCVGVALEYADGRWERLGVCEEEKVPQMSKPGVEERVVVGDGEKGEEEEEERNVVDVEEPAAIHYQYVGTTTTPGLLVQCSSGVRARSGSDAALIGDVRLCGSGWITRPMRGVLRLFFTKDSIVSIE